MTVVAHEKPVDVVQIMQHFKKSHFDQSDSDSHTWLYSKQFVATL